MAKRVSARETAFLKPKCAMKARIHFDQMNVSERGTESKKNLNEVFPTNKKKTHQFHVIKSNKEVTLKTRETCFFYRKTRKLKILKIVFKKLFSKNLLKTFFLGKSHSAEKMKSGQLSEMIN